MQIVEFSADSLRFADALPTTPPTSGFVWVYLDRQDFAQHQDSLQRVAQAIGGSQLLDLHCKDLANPAHPSHYDYTSVYDMVIFRRLATQAEAASEDHAAPQKAGIQAFHQIRSRAVGFAIFDRLLISVHPPGCYAAKSFIDRFLADAKLSVDANTGRSRIPSSPADLVLRSVNTMVDSYLDVRKDLAAQLDHWQSELLKPYSRFTDWNALMAARSQLHVLEDLCDEQHDAMQEWLDSLREQPMASFDADHQLAHTKRDLLVARARDVIEHIERVMHHARRLEQSAETVVQVHFSAQSNRTNDIMRTLTAITAVFLPLNLITGFFGMNFEVFPLLHRPNALWWTLGAMVSIAVLLGLIFWRKRYLARTRG